eukprot:13657829-Alexandrium_andersonii.AAC.1
MEQQDHLAEAVVRWWQQVSRLGPKLQVRRLGSDVWGLVRHDCRLPQTLLESAPIGAVLLAIGGPPCQQFSPTGRHGGGLGLTGKESFNVF